MSLTINVKFRNEINITEEDTKELTRLFSESKLHQVDIKTGDNIVKDRFYVNTNSTNISLKILKNVKRICSNYFNQPVETVEVEEKRITT